MRSAHRLNHGRQHLIYGGLSRNARACLVPDLMVHAKMHIGNLVNTC